MKNFTLLLLASVFFISCNVKVPPPQHIVVDDLYSLDIPVALAPMHDMYPDADLEYGNTFTQTYLVSKHSILSESSDNDSISENFKSFIDKGLEVYNERPQYKVAQTENLKINGLDAQMYYLEMTLGEMPMFMIQTFIKGKKANYEIISWTPERGKVYDTLEFKEIIESFQELQ